MQSYKFDDRNITWRTFDYLGSAYFVYAAVEQNGTVDVVIKWRTEGNKAGRELCPWHSEC